ncbi:hypothetical protein GE09DRAFT_1152125 [Coniochaeta sp. 2T2.1]|nr:hypothetical protein GE09DRAFT_1152125 [Coniochaeta sp. 2T2.1]
MSKVQCRNCDEYGHGSRDCPKPRDYSRVKCQNCQEMGHTKVRCKKPLVSEDDAGDRGFDNGGGADAGPADEEGGSSWPEEPASTVDVNSAW